MSQIPVRRVIAKVALLPLIALWAGGCGDKDCCRSLNLNPHFHPRKTDKKTWPVPCDTTITADLKTGGVDLDAAFLCENDVVTWQIPPNLPDKHTFHVKFTNGSPFQQGKSDFSDTDASGTVKGQYDKLEVYKYTITVDSMKPVDPQVVGGGNP